MLASSKHKYSKTLAFPDTYYELIINVLQSVELFCAYASNIIITKLKKYVNIYHNSPLYEMNASFTFLYLALGMSNS